MSFEIIEFNIFFEFICICIIIP